MVEARTLRFTSEGFSTFFVGKLRLMFVRGKLLRKQRWQKITACVGGDALHLHLGYLKCHRGIFLVLDHQDIAKQNYKKDP